MPFLRAAVGAGAEEICPVRAYRARLGKSGITARPVFRTIRRHGRRASRAIRCAPAIIRAGAAQNDATSHVIQRQLRHESFTTTSGYIREGRLFKGSSASFALR